MQNKRTLTCEEIMVVIEHPFGTLQIPLDEWMKNGPGIRKYLSPSAARCKDGTPLPLGVIPLRYRNNLWSRLLIGLGILKNPWERQK